VAGAVSGFVIPDPLPGGSDPETIFEQLNVKMDPGVRQDDTLRGMDPGVRQDDDAQ